VLDGLDEMDLEGSDAEPTRARQVMTWLNEHHVHAGRPAPAIVTCRAARYQRLADLGGSGLRSGIEIQVQGLEPQQIRTYLADVFNGNIGIVRAWRPVSRTLGEPGSDYSWTVLSTPWRLSLAIAMTQAGRAPSDLLRLLDAEDPVDAAARI